MISNDYKKKLIRIAKERFPDQTILPCNGFSSFEECFSFWQNQYVFWFNTSRDKSTRVVTLPA